MAFICTIDAGARPEVEREGSAVFVFKDVGYDDAEDKTYGLVVSLDINPGGNHEFLFWIVESLADAGEYLLWSGREVARTIRPDDRATILQWLLQAGRALVDAVQPQVVHMCTVDNHLPEKALVKYRLIAEMFHQCGYAVHAAEPYNGQYFWRMDRSP